MLIPLRCIALRAVKYDDRHSILSAWSIERGRVTFLIPGGSTREAARRRALLMPLSLFEGVADFRPGRDILNIRDLRPHKILPSISASPSKSVVAIFLAEFLDKTLRDSPPDENLSRFIFDSVGILDSLPARGVASFPIVFLARLSAFFGIEPDSSAWQPGRFLDMTEGIYRQSPPLKGAWLPPEEARLAATVQRLTYATASRFPLKRETRRAIIDRLLQYYAIHLAPIELRSLPILRDLL